MREWLFKKRYQEKHAYLVFWNSLIIVLTNKPLLSTFVNYSSTTPFGIYTSSIAHRELEVLPPKPVLAWSDCRARQQATTECSAVARQIPVVESPSYRLNHQNFDRLLMCAHQRQSVVIFQMWSGGGKVAALASQSSCSASRDETSELPKPLHSALARGHYNGNPSLRDHAVLLRLLERALSNIRDPEYILIFNNYLIIESLACNWCLLFDSKPAGKRFVLLHYCSIVVVHGSVGL